jgi:sugar O-acyltransferase (sialic acid O-acetyltransferase NeuD family)
MNKKICIIGSSGFAKEVYWLITESNTGYEVDCFMEPDKYWEEKTVFDIPVKKQSEFNPSIHAAVIGIGNPDIRKKVVEEQLSNETEYPSIIHPNVQMSKWVSIGKGAIICSGNIITCDITIGNFSVINLNSTIGHDCLIGDYLTVNPGVNISGLCNLGNNVYFGTNSAIRQGVTVCNDVVIGMGACVVKNIEVPGTYIGNPAKILTK